MFLAGKSFQEIAEEENVSVATIRDSIRQEKVRRNLELRERVEHENNRLRRRVQRKLENTYLSALEKLLQGQREVPFSVSGGGVVSRFVEDPKALMLGIEQYRKTVSLEEKPAPSHTTQILNVQQNSGNGGQGEDFEERLRRIRKQQEKSTKAIEKVVDVQTKEVEEEQEWDF
jgi:hypothetical protein